MSTIKDRLSSLSPERRELLKKLRSNRPGGETSERNNKPANDNLPIPNKKGVLDFSIFFFSADSEKNGNDKYEYIFKVSKFADERGFKAIWTPERHFHQFGGLYPNPSVLSAAIASVTSKCEVRAGSVVLPLHHPIRAAEEWSVVDNISNGRAGVAFASGWHPRDFVLSPMNYINRKTLMFESIKTLQKLWKGEEVNFKSGNHDENQVRIQPLPVQSDIPVWVSSSGSSSTWEKAGEMGINILTALLSQDVETLEKNIAIYKKARKRNGFGSEGGIITVMLHTYIGKSIEEVQNVVKDPFINYLRMHMELYNDHSLIKEMNVDPKEFSEEDKKALANFAFERYFHTSSLMGTIDSCKSMINELKSVGVNEIACLIDFGVDEYKVIDSLELLDQLRMEYEVGDTH
ncbi:LLM class flavin-dependent oxidoreductase [Bacillus sp. LB7]|nr:MupA/Atu3671 family FMN-dependent luciferase-like monooxygenase [Bacillus sp. LB7]MDN5386237.1 LLM class flavin-dependent oxidoreductase [Bacillus sp. LB7]